MYTCQKKSVDRPVNDITVNEWEGAECTDSTDPIIVFWFRRQGSLVDGRYIYRF